MLTDPHGNVLTSRRTPDGIAIFLKLKKENFKRRLGWYKDGIYYKHENENGIFKKLNAFGLCSDIISRPEIKGIVIVFREHRYYISKERFMENVRYLEFSKQGFERRAYVSLNFFKRRNHAIKEEY